MKKMRIQIDKNGNTKFKAEGAVGDECLEFTKDFVKAVGDVEKQDLTEDYYKDVTEDNITIQEKEK